MGITVFEEVVEITTLKVHGAGHATPVEFFIRGRVEEATISALEEYITERRRRDCWTGVYECLIQFSKDNNLPVCYLTGWPY